MAAVVDLRPAADGFWPEAVRQRGIPVLPGRGVVAVAGSGGVEAVEVRSLDPDGNGVTGARHRIECDLLAMSGGWNPAVHLFSQAQGRLRFDDALAAFVPGAAAQAVRVAGAANGASPSAMRWRKAPRPVPRRRQTRASSVACRRRCPRRAGASRRR